MDGACIGSWWDAFKQGTAPQCCSLGTAERPTPATCICFNHICTIVCHLEVWLNA